MVADGLTDVFNDYHMGITAENLVDKYNISRELKMNLQLNPNKSRTAQNSGAFDAEIVPVEVPQRKGEPLVVSQDEGVRKGTTADKLSHLRPVFKRMAQ